MRLGNTAPFEKMSQRWRAVGNTVSDLTGPRFGPQTSRSKDERVTARPTNWSVKWDMVKSIQTCNDTKLQLRILETKIASINTSALSTQIL